MTMFQKIIYMSPLQYSCLCEFSIMLSMTFNYNVTTIEVLYSIEEKQRIIHKIQFEIQEEECGLQVEWIIDEWSLVTC